MNDHVLVLGFDSRAFLTVIRSLGRRGIKVHTTFHAETHEDARIALASRYLSARHEVPTWRPGDSAWCDAILALGEKTPFRCIIPCQDEDILALEANRDALAHLHPYLLEPEVSAIANNKHESISLATRLGVAVPEQRIVASEREALAAAVELGFPVIVKPPQSFTADDLSARHEVSRVADPDELGEALAPLLSHGSVAIQRCFAGHGVGVEVLAKDGEILLAFQHERVHEPIGCGGGSSYRKSVPLRPALLDATRAMLEELRYTGVGMFEFMVPSDGDADDDWIFLEINARFWGSLPVSLAAGLDFPWSLYQMWTEGQREFPSHYKEPVYCRNTSMDLNWMLANARGLRSHPPLRNTLPWTSVLTELGHLLSFKESNDTLVLDDPKPGLVELDLMRSRSWKRVSSKLRNKRREKMWRSKPVQQRLRTCLRDSGDISFLCYGNICRSPMAERLLQADLPERTITSCGFHERTQRSSPAMAQHVSPDFGVDLESHRSKHVKQVLADRPVAVVFVFDPLLAERAERELPEFAERVFPLGAIDPAGPLWMDDPYGGDASTFEACYRDIEACIRRIAKVVHEGENDVA